LSDETIRLVIAAALVVNVALLAILCVAAAARELRKLRFASRPRLVPTFGESPAREGMGLLEWLPETGRANSEPSYDRVFRIASWAFLLVASGIVAVSGLWGGELSRIVALIAVAGAFVLLIHDILPTGSLRPFRAVAQAVVALAFAAILVYLTGGYVSPFFFAFALLVGGAALVVPPSAALALAVAAAAAYLGVATLASGPPTTIQIVATVVDLTGMFLLTYIAASVGREQHRARDAALRMSALDSLTGLYNRPFLFAAVAREIARSQRSGRGFCLVMLDLDDLKEINDRHGHHAGDAVLRAIADTLRTSIRRADVAARYGGDEFVTLLPETDPTGGWVVAEKIRQALRDRGMRGFDFRPTVSLGVVSYPADGRSADTLLMSADRAMYVAKRGGKDRVASVPPGDGFVGGAHERATSEVAGRN
jgi:diguanylate cyclase (GGDEF)-like protein